MSETLDHLLRQATIFRRLGADDRQRLAAVATTRTFAKGSVLFREGDGSDYLFVVTSGRV